MSIEPIGLLTIVAGLLCLLLGFRAAFAVLVVSTLFGAAAAVLIGPANIQPAHLLLGFVAATMLMHGREAGAALAAAISRPHLTARLSGGPRNPWWSQNKKGVSIAPTPTF